MKKLLFALLLCVSAALPAQTVIRQMFAINAAGNQLPGVTILPADYSKTTDSLGLIIVSHGVGEAGNGTVGTLGDYTDPKHISGIFANGTPLYLAATSAVPFSAVSPTTGKILRFIVVGLQGINGWCAYASDNDYVVQQLLKQYRITKGAVFATGLSAGARVSWEMLAGPNAALYAAAVPMSTPAITTSICDFKGPANNFTKVWALHGNTDGSYTDPINSVHALGYLDAVRKGLTHYTVYQCGHGCWDTEYNPATRELITYYYNGVKATKSMNVYEFMAASVSGSNFVFDTAGGSVPPPVVVTPPVQPPASTTKAVANITTTGNTITLDGSASIGNGRIQSSGWRVTDLAGNYVKPQSVDSGIMDAGPNAKPAAVIKLPNGTYNITLTVQDQYGGTDKTVQQVTVGAVVTGPSVVQTFTAAGITYTLLSDHTWK